jgi:hypothetical protein
MNRTEKLDVAIIGGGIAGLHVADRLTDPEYRRAGRKRTIILFEATERLGGRLKSVHVPGVNFPLELGAMRFRKSHRLLKGLIDNLGVKDGEMAIPAQQFFLRGRRHKSFRWLASKAYLLPSEERRFAVNPEKLIAFGIYTALGRFEFPLLRDIDHRKITAQISQCDATPESLSNLDWNTIVGQAYLQLGPKAVPLWGIGFWNLLAHVLSNQAMRLIEDSLGYHSIIGNWNAAVALPWFVSDFRDKEWYVPIEGFSSLVSRLSQRIRTNGGTIKIRSELVGISRSNRPGGYQWELTFGKGKRARAYLAKRIVLAVPRAALERLNIQVTGWPEVREDLLPTVKPHNLLKIHLVYERAWWAKTALPGGDSGIVITDQPLRQIYYYGPQWIANHAPKRLKHQTPAWPFIMASYCDSYYTEFWSTFFERSWRFAWGDVYFNETRKVRTLDDARRDTLRKIRDEDGVHWRMVNKIHRQLADLHQLSVESLPMPILGLFMNWEWEPYSGGWHTWEVSGFPPWQAAELMLEPVRGMYVCGEAYSNQQGWIEGALNTAEEVLCKKFQLSPPSWLGVDHS